MGYIERIIGLNHNYYRFGFEKIDSYSGWTRPNSYHGQSMVFYIKLLSIM
jgi:predicted N-acetyltransferase YhbS